MALIAYVDGGYVFDLDVYDTRAIVPATSLLMSDVLFASDIPAVVSAGKLTEKDAMTFRFRPNASMVCATLNSNNSGINVTGAESGTFLVVQNSDGAYSVAVNNSTSYVSAEDILINGSRLSSLGACRIWLEKTIDNITYASYAGAESVEESQNTTCQHSYEWVAEKEPTEFEDGELVCRCSKCGNISGRQPISSYNYYISNCTARIKKAAAGDTVIFTSNIWNAFPVSFFNELAKRRDITVILDTTYKHSNYETTIYPSDDIDTSCKYYGFEKIRSLYTTEKRDK